MIAYASEATCIAQDFLGRLNVAVLYPLITMLLAVAFLWFLYGGMRFILSANEPTKREEGRQHMLYGIIGLLVMVSAYTILAIAANSFGVNVDNVRCGPDGTPLTNEGVFGVPDEL